MKKRILMVTEASTTMSGYGTYTKEVLSRLHKMGKYEIAELAGYANLQTPGIRDIPWKVYPNHLNPNIPDERHAILNSQPINQFGAWRFERVCLDFKPDIVFDIRDPWMLMFENQSPLRKYFHWAIMPTVDSAPQQEEWIDHFTLADKVFTYSDWGMEVLKKQGGGLINIHCSAPPGVDEKVFKPHINKFEHKRNLGFDPNSFIVGTVMRNQRRKLFPNLLNAFKIYLDKCISNGNKELAQRSFLYFHTGYPDVVGCWNMPRILKESGISHKVLWTYICRNCRNIAISVFQDGRTVCTNCQNVASMLPTVSDGLSREQLADIINLFDVYAQYATCEGFGMPQVEAAACGVPVFATDYSAMSDVVRKLNGYPIRVQKMERIVEEDAYKALPDDEDMAEKLYKFAILSPAEKRKRGEAARSGVEKHYLWDQTAQIWADHFDSVVLKDNQGKWNAPMNLISFKADLNNPPPIPSNEDFVQWAIVNSIGPEYLNSLMALDMVRALNYEMIVGLKERERYTRKHVTDKLQAMVNNHNQCEQVRCGVIPLHTEDYLEFANRKRK